VHFHVLHFHALQVGPSLSGHPYGKGRFWGKGAPIVKYMDFLHELCKKTAELIDLPFGLCTRVG